MKLTFRKGNIDDLNDLKQLAINSWGQFKTALTNENWQTLSDSLNDDKTYSDLLKNSDCIVCLTDKNKIVGMTFLVSRGNPVSYTHLAIPLQPRIAYQLPPRLPHLCVGDTAHRRRRRSAALP